MCSVGKLCCLVLLQQAVCSRGFACTCGRMPLHYMGVPSTLLELICMLQCRLHIHAHNYRGMRPRVQNQGV